MTDGFELRRELFLPLTPEEVFPFFSDPLNLAEITPPWMRFRVVSAPEGPLREGAEIRYRLRLRGLPLRWTSRISAWDPPRRFVDEQVRGPYSAWIHEHTFEPTSSGTLCRDHVRYAVLGGRLVERLLVRPDLERIFAHRNARLRELLAPAP